MTDTAFPWSVVPAPGVGEKHSGYFSWPETVLAGLQWPYFAVRGAQPGPAMAITAAVHGGEYPGPLGALRLGKLISPARLRGSVLLLPIVNLPSFWERSAFVTPTDGKNLNRSFPGSPNGTFSEVLAWRLLQDIVYPASATIDLHSGDIFETLASHSYSYRIGMPDIDDLTVRMVEAFGLPWALSYPRPSNRRGLHQNAALADKPSMLMEVGGNGLASDDEVQLVFQGLVNALRALGMLEGQIVANPTRWVEEGAQLSAPVTGLWRPAVTLEQHVRAGDALGALSDPLGAEIAAISAPHDGMVLYYLTTLAAKQGDPLVNLVKLAE